MSRTREPSTVVISILDISEYESEALELIQRDEPAASVVSSLTWGIVETSSGEIYALSTEGVGPSHPITTDDPLEVDFWVRGYSDGRNTFSMSPQAGCELGPERLRRCPVRERVLLHDFVRSFGSRLEANYSIWNRVLTEALEKVKL